MTIAGHSSNITDLIFSTDDCTIFSCSVDGTVYSHTVSTIPHKEAVPYTGEYVTRGGTAVKIVTNLNDYVMVYYDSSNSDNRVSVGGYLAIFKHGIISDTPQIIQLDINIKDISLGTIYSNNDVNEDICILGGSDGSVIISFFPLPIIDKIIFFDMGVGASTSTTQDKENVSGSNREKDGHRDSYRENNRLSDRENHRENSSINLLGGDLEGGTDSVTVLTNQNNNSNNQNSNRGSFGLNLNSNNNSNLNFNNNQNNSNNQSNNNLNSILNINQNFNQSMTQSQSQIRSIISRKSSSTRGSPVMRGGMMSGEREKERNIDENGDNNGSNNNNDYITVSFLDMNKCKSNNLHCGSVISVIISSDGNRILSIGEDGAIFMLTLSAQNKTNIGDIEEEIIPVIPNNLNSLSIDINSGESSLMLADKKSFNKLRNQTSEIRLTMEETLRDSEKAIIKLSEQTEQRVNELEIKLKREVSKRDIIILNEREDHRKQRLNLNTIIATFEKKQSEIIARVELGYEQKLAQEALYLDRMRQVSMDILVF